ncbi:DUF6299 family protein [Nocardia sp. NPDC049149]|uniref:DUF6299 family protein n=1 Tax=Nocardia sp. NPDC049149 TaxID=3364315 RepID=UPI003717E916
MVEYFRTAERWTTIPGKLVAAAAVVLAATVLQAGPTEAASSSSLTVDKTQRLNADGSVTIKGTYTCTGGRTNSLRNSWLRQGEVQSELSMKTAILIPCDGAAHPYTVDIPNTTSFPFKSGPAEFNNSWDFYCADGNHSSAALTDAPITLQE